MHSSTSYYLVALLLLTFVACSDSSYSDQANMHEKTESSASDSSFQEVQDLIQESINYLQNRDFDGDGQEDYLIFSYSGGAHCCYSLSLAISSLGDTINYPFDMDGGYGFGIVDGSNHDQFDIDDYDADGLDEIFMGISTYNGEISAIDEAWTKEYGIHSNYILFDFNKGKIELMDYNPELHLDKTK